jgi:hypothetical protein
MGFEAGNFTVDDDAGTNEIMGLLRTIARRAVDAALERMFPLELVQATRQSGSELAQKKNDLAGALTPRSRDDRSQPAMNAKYYEERAAQILKPKKTEATAESDAIEPPLAEPVANSTPAKVIQLPLWPEPMRAAPTVILRSSIFGVLARGTKRPQLDKELLASWGETAIRYTGKRLDQYDEDVWLQTLHLARLQNANDYEGISFTARGFLKAFGRKSGGGNAIARLDDSMLRMVACAVVITDGQRTYMGNLIHSVKKDEVNGRYVVCLNPDIAKLFGGGYTQLEWQTRLELKTDLARWLQAFVLTHRATDGHPQRVAVKDLRDLSGVAQDDLKYFRRNLKAAMMQLHEFGIVKSWRITDNDALEFVRQQRKELPQQVS